MSGTRFRPGHSPRQIRGEGRNANGRGLRGLIESIWAGIGEAPQIATLLEILLRYIMKRVSALEGNMKGRFIYNSIRISLVLVTMLSGLTHPRRGQASDFLSDQVVQQNMIREMFKIDGRVISKVPEEKFQDQVLTFQTELHKRNKTFKYYSELPDKDLVLLDFPIFYNSLDTNYYYMNGFIDRNGKCIMKNFTLKSKVKIFIGLNFIIVVDRYNIFIHDIFFFRKLIFPLTDNVIDYCSVRSYFFAKTVYKDRAIRSLNYYAVLSENGFVIYLMLNSRSVHSKLTYDIKYELRANNFADFLTDPNIQDFTKSTGFSPEFIRGAVSDIYKQALGSVSENINYINPQIDYPECNLYFGIFNNTIQNEVFLWDFNSLIGGMSYGYIRTSRNILRNAYEAILSRVDINLSAPIDTTKLILFIKKYDESYYNGDYVYGDSCINPIISLIYNWPFMDCVMTVFISGE